MIYITEQGFIKQLELLTFLSGKYKCDLIIWLYPESNVNEFLGLDLVEGDRFDGNPVTTYANGLVSKRTKRQLCTDEVITLLKCNESLISRNCDSCALYLENSNDWFATTIGHEGVCLVTNDELFNELRSIGFIASLNPPEWW